MAKLASEKVIIEAPTSFSGSAKRIWKITDIGADNENSAIKIFIKLITIPTAISLIFIVWSFVIIWYIIIYSLFGIFVIPFRLFTRGKRKRKIEALRHREVMDALNNK